MIALIAIAHRIELLSNTIAIWEKGAKQTKQIRQNRARWSNVTAVHLDEDVASARSHAT